MTTTTATTAREVGTVFVTGGASGLGAAVVRAVRDAGGTPAVLDLHAADGAPSVAVDLADSGAVPGAVADLVAQVGPPSAVVTAAGIDACGPLLDIDADAWE